jgi:hypothetical protein
VARTSLDVEKVGSMPRLKYKSFSNPDEVRRFSNAYAEVIRLDETTVGRSHWSPGWRWSVDLAPAMGTPSCQVHHLGHSISGVLHVLMDDGESLDIPPDSIFEIPPDTTHGWSAKSRG